MGLLLPIKEKQIIDGPEKKSWGRHFFVFPEVTCMALQVEGD